MKFIITGAFEKIFQEPGLVWLEDDGRHTRFRTVSLAGEQWKVNTKREVSVYSFDDILWDL